MNNVQERVERSLFELIRKIIVANGYLPDVANNTKYPLDSNGNLTPTAQVQWKTDLNTIINNKGWALPIFGTSSAFAKGFKEVPRVVIVSKRIMPGEIGLPPGFVYYPAEDPNNPLDYKKASYPPESANMHFDFHLLSSNQVQSRFLNNLISTGLCIKKYIPFYDNPNERFFIKMFNYYDISDQEDGVEENVYSYEVQDLYLFDDVEYIIKPILEIKTNAILGYTVVNDNNTPDYPNESNVTTITQ